MLIHGRDAELTAIERLLGDARAGRSGALVLRGEAGIGKSLLLDHAATAEDLRVLRGSGIETESELPFAGLHLLLSRHTSGASRLTRLALADNAGATRKFGGTTSAHSHSQWLANPTGMIAIPRHTAMNAGAGGRRMPP